MTPPKLREWRRKHRDEYNAYQREWRAANPEKCAKYRAQKELRRHHNWLSRQYGISEEAYFKLLGVQGGGCAACGSGPLRKNKFLDVDHDHSNGKIRGLLCTACNMSLGYMKDSTDLLRKAIAYLEAHAD